MIPGFPRVSARCRLLVCARRMPRPTVPRRTRCGSSARRQSGCGSNGRRSSCETWPNFVRVGASATRRRSTVCGKTTLPLRLRWCSSGCCARRRRGCKRRPSWRSCERGRRRRARWTDCSTPRRRRRTRWKGRRAPRRGSRAPWRRRRCTHHTGLHRNASHHAHLNATLTQVPSTCHAHTSCTH